MNKTILYCLFVIGFVVVTLFTYIFLENRSGNVSVPTSTTKNGFYFDENNNKLGNCIVSENEQTFNTYTTYFDNNKNLIGHCTKYHGPGSSGGCKSSCDTKELSLSENGSCQKYDCQIQ